VDIEQYGVQNASRLRLLSNHRPAVAAAVAIPEARVKIVVELLLLIGGLVSVANAQTPPPRASHRLPLDVLPETLAVCRLPADTPLPAWATGPALFLTISRTAEELSITTAQAVVPPDVRCERDYRALRVHGTLPPNLVGILLSIAEPLAQAGLSIFAISTYDTDYVLVKARDLPAALEALRRAGHKVNS